MYRIGTTSYIIPAEILPNVDYLAGRVSDIQLVLFETDTHGSNLPDAALCRALRDRAERFGLTYTVHLPLDLRLADGGIATHESLIKARKVIEATRELDPAAYTVHLDGGRLPPPWGACRENPLPLSIWQDQAVQALETVSRWVTDPGLLCVENLEKWNPDAFEAVLDRVPVSRTADIGHLWLEQRDPVPLLERWCSRIRVVHLHGIGTRDHQSLALMDEARRAPVVRWLKERFNGILTVEVFNEQDLAESLAFVRPVGEGA
ncbi:MAG: cobamide remodeling phosphodiesterase CbiR [Kiritimatiellia bacterium]